MVDKARKGPAQSAGNGQGFHVATVGRRTMLSPGIMRLSFCGDGLAGFRSTGCADEYLRLFFPDPDTGELVLPIIDDRGHWRYHEGKPPVRCSTYTVRRFDETTGTLDIDFVVHAGGLASDWACRAEPGDTVVLNSPRGLTTLPSEVGTQLLMSDLSGLPALSRLLEQTAADVRSDIFIEAPSRDHDLRLPAHPRATVTWLDLRGEPGETGIADVLDTVRPAAVPHFVWAAGEQKRIRKIRQQVRNVLNLPADRHSLVAYWIDNPLQVRAPAGNHNQRIAAEDLKVSIS